MQEQFWNEAGRKAWPRDEKEKVFLGNGLLRLGEVTFKQEWTGRKNLPSKAQAEALQERIALAAVNGDLLTFVLDPKSLEFRSIPSKTWRKLDGRAAWFSLCKMNVDNLDRRQISGDGYGSIFVDASGFQNLLDEADPSIIRLGELEGKGVFISTYLRFMADMADALNLDAECLPGAKTLANELLKRWPEWRKKKQGAPGDGRLTPRLAHSMATVMRGEVARAAKGGGQTK